MVIIRLARTGAKRKPFYHVVVAESHEPRDGRNIERLGFFNPVARGGDERLRLDTQRVDEWLKHGAQISPRVKRLLQEARQQDAQQQESAA